MIRVAVAFIIFCLIPSIGLGQNSAVRWYVFDMGFGIPTSSTTSVKSAVGQSFVGTTQQANARIESGFLVDSLFRGPLVAVGENEGLPSVYSLSQNYPNPFNPSTTIRFELPRRSKVELSVFNILGQKIATLINEERDAGRYSIVWSGTSDYGLHVASGVYFYRIHVFDPSTNRDKVFVETKKLVLIK